jgi:hypothetical protein
MDRVRIILTRIEDSPSGWAAPPFGLQGFTPEEVRYQADIMTEDGLIERIDGTNMRGTATEAAPRALTANGHDFLDLARDQARWNKAHAILRKVGSAPIGVWMKVLNDLLLKDMAVVF